MLKKMIAECIGTFVLVFVACGTAALTKGELVATSLAFGLALIAMAYSIGRISGCHINPAVSLGLAINKKITWTEFGCYVVAQLVGGILGGIVLFGILKAGLNGTGQELFYAYGNASNYAVGYSAAGKLGALRIIGTLCVEIILTFIFVYVILNVTSSKSDAKNLAGLLIGLTLVAVHLVGIGLTGTSVNPARSIGTALSSVIYGGDKEALKQVWMFIVAPLAGGALAGVCYMFLHKEDKDEAANASNEQ